MIGQSGDLTLQRQIDEQGYAVVPVVFTAGEMIALVVSLADLTQHDHRAGIRHVLKHPAINVISHDRRLLNVVRAILGDSAFPFRATFFDKSPDSNWLITWHQDTALPVTEKKPALGWGPWSIKDGVTYAHAPASALEQVLALRVHLDDSTAENGPLRVLPRTHNVGVLSDDQVATAAAERAAVHCTAQKGGVVAMRPLIVHASSKSESNQSRRVLHIEYAACTKLGQGLELAVT